MIAPIAKKSFATLCNDESEWATEAKEALQWRARQHMNAAHDGTMAWPEVAALLVTRWSEDWAEQYECPEAAGGAAQGASGDDEWCSWGSVEPPAQPPTPPEAFPKPPLVSPPRWGRRRVERLPALAQRSRSPRARGGRASSNTAGAAPPEAAILAQLSRIEDMLQGVVNRLDVLARGKRKGR